MVHKCYLDISQVRDKIGVHIGEVEDFKKTLQLLIKFNIKFCEVGPSFFIKNKEKMIAICRDKLKEKGINIWSVHAPFDGKADLSNPNVKKRNLAIKIHKKLFRKISIMGIKTVVVHPGVKLKSEREESKRLNFFSQSIQELLPVAEKLKLKIAVENMLPLHGGSNPTILFNLMKKFNSPYLGICFDTGHAHVKGDVRKIFSILKKYVITFHIHDNDGTSDKHLQPPYGTIDWESFFSLLKTLQYRGPFIVEAGPWGKVDVGWMKKEVESLFAGQIVKKNDFYLKCSKCGHYLFGRRRRNSFCYCSTSKIVS